MTLWGGRFADGLDSAMEPLNRSLDVDWRLWRQDIEGSRAWAEALAKAEVITPGESAELSRGLDAVEAQLTDAPGPALYPDEDVHSLVERLLTEHVGAVGGKLHTGRSRNDQVSTDFRLWGLRAAERVRGDLRAVAAVITRTAEQQGLLPMPAYTHLQQAQPTSAAHWLLSRAWPLVRDLERFEGVEDACSVLPLGSGAVAGCAFPIDRAGLAKRLGFRRVSENSTDAVSDRDWAAEFVFAAAMVGVHLSQFAEDLVLFSSREFGFVTLGDGFTTGSSLMPQKKNPDVAELVRGKSGRLMGNVTRILTVLKGLPTGYNRDLQEDKEAVFDSADTLLLVLPAVAGAIGSMTLHGPAMERGLGAELFATDLADYLVAKGVPFRESHHVVGRLVRLAEDSDRDLAGLSAGEMKSVHEAFEGDVQSVFDVRQSLESRSVSGGTSRTALAAQISEIRARLAE